MAYIVDGNNVMGQIPGWHRDKSAARRGLLEQLAVFARVRKSRITVVFDGAPDRDFPDGSAFHGVRVVYAEKGSNADARILKIADSSADPRGLKIVTSDRELGVQAGFRGAQVIRSGEFRRLMEQAEETDRAEEAEPSPIEAVDGWMRYFGVGPDDEEDHE